MLSTESRYIVAQLSSFLEVIRRRGKMRTDALTAANCLRGRPELAMWGWSNSPSPSCSPSVHGARRDPWHRTISRADHSLIPSIKSRKRKSKLWLGRGPGCTGSVIDSTSSDTLWQQWRESGPTWKDKANKEKEKAREGRETPWATEGKSCESETTGGRKMRGRNRETRERKSDVDLRATATRGSAIFVRGSRH